MRMTLGKKICAGFSVVVLAIVAGAAVVMYQLDRSDKLNGLVLDVRQPTVLAATSLESALNRTQVAIRGTIILGEERFKSDRAKAWESAATELETLKKLSAQFEVQKDRERLAVVETGLTGLRTAQDQAERLTGTLDNIPALKTLSVEVEPIGQRLVAAISSMIDEERTLGADADRKALLAAMADTRGTLGLAIGYLRAFGQSGKGETKADFDKYWTANAAAAARVDALHNTMSAKQAASWQAFRKDRAEFDSLGGKVISLRSAPDWNRTNALLLAAAPGVAAARTNLTELMAAQRELASTEIQAAHAADRTVTIVLGVVVIFSAAVSALTAFIIARGVSRAVAPIVARTTAIASGNLTGEPLVATSSDELADITRAVNEMDAALRSVVSEVAVSSEEVSAAATQIAASSEEMSAGIKDQTRQLGEVNSAMAEMSASIGEVAAKSNHAAKTATDSGSTAEAGAEIVRGTIEDMREIGLQSSASVASVESLGDKSKKIGEVVAVINDVAEQINLLALNAAIEAARAGEHGRGFAVVADEVRKLADRTQTATQEISSSITGIQNETAAVVGSIRGGTQRVELGMGRAAKADTSLRSIIDSAGAVASLVNSIAAAATQQAATGEQINRTVGGVAAAARESEAASGQCAAAANQLSARAERLRTLVGRFKLNQTANTPGGQPRAAAAGGSKRARR